MAKATPKKITSLTHPLIKHLVMLRKESSYREETKSILLTSETILHELPSPCLIKAVLTTDISRLKNLTHYDTAYEVSAEILQKISGLQDSGGLCAEVALPSPSLLHTVSRLLVLDTLSDPGNVGTLLRTALAFGWDGVFLMGSGVDVFNDKVIRSSRAALFHLPYRMGSFEELDALQKANNLRALVADVAGTALPTIGEVKNVLLVLSNEARGPSASFEKWGEKVTIPMSGNMESLNVAVAGGILLYELTCHG